MSEGRQKYIADSCKEKRMDVKLTLISIIFLTLL